MKLMSFEELHLDFKLKGTVPEEEWIRQRNERENQMTRRQQKVNCQCCNFSVHLNENYLDHLGRKLHPTCFIKFTKWGKK